VRVEQRVGADVERIDAARDSGDACGYVFGAIDF